MISRQVRLAWRALVGCLLLSAVLLPGCGLLEEKQHAEKVIDEYFSLVQQADIEGALRLFTAPSAAERDRLLKVPPQLGKPSAWKQGQWRTFTGTGGTVVNVTYAVTYAGGGGERQVQEQFELFKGPDGFKIRRHSMLADPVG